MACGQPVVLVLSLGVIRNIKRFSFPKFHPCARSLGEFANELDDERQCGAAVTQTRKHVRVSRHDVS